MRVETERMYLYPLSDEEMRLVIEKESDPEMKQAYTEMLEGSLSHPDNRIWYTIVGGVPAKPIRKRFNEETIDILLKLKWWDWSKEKIAKNIAAIQSGNLGYLL